MLEFLKTALRGIRGRQDRLESRFKTVEEAAQFARETADDIKFGIFGQSMIFHRFPKLADATRLAQAVAISFARDVAIFHEGSRAARVAFFPFEIEGPAVLVSRLSHDAPISGSEEQDERDIESHVTQFGGEFAGT